MRNFHLAGRSTVHAQNGMVATSHPLAALTAIEVLKSGGTAADAAVAACALLGVIVGTVIVAQTLYSSTKDHLSEFATLRAMGSSNRYIYNVIIYQALLNAVIGFAIAAGLGAVVVQITAKSALPIVITPWLMAALAVLTVVMCVASAIGAIVRVVRIDPATVFMR